MNQTSKLDNELAQYRQNFYRIYQNKVIPAFKEMEKLRKEELSYFIFIKIAGFLILLFGLYMNTWHHIPEVVSYPFGMFGLMLLFSQLSANSLFAKKIKSKYMPTIVESFGNMHWVDQGCLISGYKLRSSQLFSSFNRREHYDSFKGTYKDVCFNIEETYIYKQTGEGRRTRVIEPVFTGVIIEFPINKKNNEITIVTNKCDTNIRSRDITVWVIFLNIMLFLFVTYFGHMVVVLSIGAVLAIVIVVVSIVLKLLNKKSEFVLLNEIKLEDPVFSKKYRVYSSDQVEGRYMVTTAFMERFKNLQTAFGSKNAKCSFCGDSLIFAISTNKNLFEIGNLFHSIENPKQMTEFFNELSSILALIDYFKLNEKTGL